MSAVKRSRLASSECQVTRSESIPDPSLEAAAAAAAAPIVVDEWIQCTKCEKWRLICARAVKARSLPENWECRMMTWLPGFNSCRDSEKTTTAAAYELLGVPGHEIDLEILNATCNYGPVSERRAVSIDANQRRGVETNFEAGTGENTKLKGANSTCLPLFKTPKDVIAPKRKSLMGDIHEQVPVARKDPERRSRRPAIEDCENSKMRRPEDVDSEVPRFSNCKMNNSVRREEASFWVMHARMEAAALIKAAADLRRRMPDSEDERPIADLYLQAGLKYLQTARHQEVICARSHGQGSGDMSYLHNYIDGVEILDVCTEKYERISDNGKASMCHILAGVARMRLLTYPTIIRSSFPESTNQSTMANSGERTEYRTRRMEILRLNGCSVATLKQFFDKMDATASSTHNQFLKNSANISPMLESWIKARDCLARAEAARGNSKYEEAMLEVRKVCSMAMFDDFEKLISQVYVALNALGNII